MNRDFVIKCMVLGGLAILAHDCAFASNFSTGMPWEAPLQKVVRSITGPVARGSALVALTIAGCSWAFGAGGDIVQRAAKMGTGLSVAFGGTSYILPMFGFAQGALF